jgi:hypothetical protein
MHGLMNVFHHLIADFIECGHVKKARKIMEVHLFHSVLKSGHISDDSESLLRFIILVV